MNDLEKLWQESNVKHQPTHRVVLNAPETKFLTPLEKDGLPFAAHDMSFSPFLSSPEAQSRHTKMMEALTSSWGPSSPNTIDYNALKNATNSLMENAFAGNLDGVKMALSQGADANTLIWVKDTSTPTPIYRAVPLGAGVAMFAQHQKQQKIISSTKEFDEVAFVLSVDQKNQSRIQVGPDQDGQTQLGFTVSNIYPGEKAQYRHIPLSMSQQVAIQRAVPQSMIDGFIPEQTDGVALGEELPKNLRDTYSDLYDPARDTLVEALHQYRAKKVQSPASQGLSPPTPTTRSPKV